MGSEKRNELDQLIDSALAGYVDAEPLAGLEQRVLERVRLAEVSTRSRLWWVLAAVTFATVVLAIVATRPRPIQPLVGQAFRPAAAILPSAPAEGRWQAERPAPPKQKTRNRATRSRLPKREQFPTPTPLTAEERALIQLARLNPEGLQSLAELRPIEIAPIEIERIDQNQ